MSRAALASQMAWTTVRTPRASGVSDSAPTTPATWSTATVTYMHAAMTRDAAVRT